MRRGFIGPAGDLLDAREDALGDGSRVGIGGSLERLRETLEKRLIVCEESQARERGLVIAGKDACKLQPGIGAVQLGPIKPVIRR